jgi:hypothetical protein
MLGTVYPNHPLVKNISDSICRKVEQLRQENKLIANANCLAASKPKAELIMLILIPLAIISLPIFKIAPQPLIDICRNSYLEAAACYLAGIMLVLGTLLYANHRKLGAIGWLTLAGIVIMLAVNYAFAQWALVLLLSFFPAVGLIAALVAPYLYSRWNRARNLSKSARKNQLAFNDKVLFDVYKEGAASFLSSSPSQLPADSTGSAGAGGTAYVTNLESIATEVSVPERSVHLPMLLVRGAGVLAATAAITVAANVYYKKYDKRMSIILAAKQQTRTEIATTKSEAAMRISASASSKRVTTLSKGAKVRVLDQNNEWTHVRYKEYEGYIKNSLLQMNK